MEHQDNNTPAPEQDLWLTENLLQRLSKTAGILRYAMVVCTLLCISAGCLTLIEFWMWAKWVQGGIYILHPDTFPHFLKLFSSLLTLTFFTLGILEGKRIWPMLSICADNDDALLEGSERLGKMFRWFSWWGGAVLIFIALDYLLMK